MGSPTDVVITWMASPPSDAWVKARFDHPVRFLPMPMPHDPTDEDKWGQHYKEQFQWQPSEDHPWVIGGWPHPLRAIFQKYGVTNPLRVAVIGFSQGCQGVGTILRSQDAGYVEHAIAIDGIHCSWYPGKTPNEARDNIEPSCLGTWKAAAALAARKPMAMGGLPPGQRYLTITHSGITPSDYPSTSDTARAIMAATWEDPPYPDLPHGLVGMNLDPPFTAKGYKYTHDTNTYAAGEGGLTILGYGNLDPSGAADHIYQGQVVLLNVIEKLLAARWNATDPLAPTCGGQASGATGGPSCNPVAPVAIPPDYFKDPQDASIDWAKYMPPMEPASESVVPFILSMLLGGGLIYGGVKLWQKRQASRKP